MNNNNNNSIDNVKWTKIYRSVHKRLAEEDQTIRVWLWELRHRPGRKSKETIEAVRLFNKKVVYVTGRMYEGAGVEVAVSEWRDKGSLSEG